MPQLPDPTALLGRLRRDVDRARFRTQNGLKHLSGRDQPEVGGTPRELVWERDKVRLYRYESGERRFTPPVLVVMSLATKPYVFDLRPGNSFVQALLDRGLDVYALDWGIPDATEADNTLETYCDEYLPRAVQAVVRSSGAAGVSLWGYCFGGVLSLLYVAGHPHAQVHSLVLMATPIDFGYLGPMSQLLRSGRIEPIDLLDETGNVPAQVMLTSVRSQKVTGDLVAYASLLQNLENSEYVTAHRALVGWTRDHIPFAGACFRQTIELFVRDDQLVRGRIELGDRVIDLRNITCPTLSVVGEADHIVPPESTAPLTELVANLDHVRAKGGHVGLFVGGTAHRRTIPAMCEWLEMHGEVPR